MTSKQFCLKWNNFQSNILNAFESLQNTEDLTDVTLTCEGINVKAHKFILSACSPYFRTVFKENPCTHPIIILKDVFYSDLLAIINFMYHGQVLVSEEQLASFLETAKLLQVSGLNNADNAKKPPKKAKKAEPPESPAKKAKLSAALKGSPKKIQSDTESIDVRDEEELADVNENLKEKSDALQSSILEAALEKPESILERSLTSAGKDTPEAPKSAFIPRKPPEAKSGSSSPSTFDRPCEFLQQSIKIEEESFDSLSFEPDEALRDARSLDVPHHSSQCGNCPHCGKVYSNQSALKYHVRLVHSDLTNMYCCHLCPEAFNYREGYKKHMVEVHCIRN